MALHLYDLNDNNTGDVSVYHEKKRIRLTAIACKGSGLNKSMKAQIATLGENLYYLKLWRHCLLSVAVHNLNRRSCFEAVKARDRIVQHMHRRHC
jgi:hypothetical protein